MKIALVSDAHLEFGQLDLENTEGADVLILAGDICVAKDLMIDVSCYGHGQGTRSQRFHDFFQAVTGKFKDVIYVAGNHEHYHGDFAKTYSILKENLAYLKNLHILDKETVTIDDVTFVGGTLWTDFNNEDPVTMFTISSMMNDFIQVKNSNRDQIRVDSDGNNVTWTPRFTPDDAFEDHCKTLKVILNTVDANPDGKFVVVGHHSPSRQSTHPRYANDELMNGGYSSRLDFIIEDRPQIKYWVHGHTHHCFKYKIGETTILCNPRGYIGYEEQADEFELKYFEV